MIAHEFATLVVEVEQTNMVLHAFSVGEATNVFGAVTPVVIAEEVAANQPAAVSKASVFNVAEY